MDALPTRAWNLAVLKDQLAGVGPPHAEFVELLCRREARHALKEAYKQGHEYTNNAQSAKCNRTQC